jgi:hypothetical protein
MPRPSFLISSSSVNHKGRRIKARARLRRLHPAWSPRTWGIRHLHPEGTPRRTLAIRPPGMAPTYTAHPLRTAVRQALPNRLSCRAPGPPHPTLWAGQAQGYMASARRRPFPVQAHTAGTDPVPHHPSLAAPRARVVMLRVHLAVPRRLFPGHLLPPTGRLATTTVLLRGLPMSALARCSAGLNHTRCCLHPMVSVVPRISRSRTHSSTL